MAPDNHTADGDWEGEMGDVHELERLRAADPAPSDVIDEIATGARARALRTELTMQTENPTPHPTHPTPTPTWRRTALAGLALAVVALGGVAVALQLAGDGDVPSDDVAGPVATPDDGTAPGTGEQPDVMPPGGGMAMCVATYSAETLAEREVAFAGTVTAMAGDDITFAVEEVFRGDLGETVTLGGAEFIGGVNPDNPTPVAVGDRLLVAGDGGFAWGCGFTQPYDEDVAATWRAAFNG